jgi:ADP-ribose pyrophosphatase
MSSDARQSRYREIRLGNPDLFGNPPDAPIRIVDDPQQIAEIEDAAGRRLRARGMPPAWGRTGVVFEDEYALLVRDPVRFASGATGTYVRSLAIGSPGVVVLPVSPDGVVLVRHFRHSTRRWHLEAPRGFGNAGSTPEADARRELAEEIAATPDRLESLGSVYPDTGATNSCVRLFIAHVTTFRAAGGDEGIDSARAIPPDEVGKLILSGEISDGFTICAYTRALLRGCFNA